MPPRSASLSSASYQGLTMQEISAQTGESLVNVRHHYYRGLKKLRLIVDEGSTMPKGSCW